MFEALRIVWRLVIVDPLRSGLVRPSRWPPMLRWLARAMLVFYLACIGVVLAVPALRGRGDLVRVWEGVFLPATVTPVIAVGLWLCLTLLNTAALRLGWPLKLLALLNQTACCLILLPFVLTSWVLWVCLGALVVLAVVMLLPQRRGITCWDLSVVAAATFGCSTLPLHGAAVGLSLGQDIRPLLLSGVLQIVFLLATPGLTVAGATLTQVSTQIGLATGVALTGRGAPTWLALLLGLLLVWRTWTVFAALASEPPGALLLSLAWTGIGLVMIWIACLCYQHLAGRNAPGNPHTLIEPFTGVSYLLVLAASCGLIAPQYLSIARFMLPHLGIVPPP